MIIITFHVDDPEEFDIEWTDDHPVELIAAQLNHAADVFDKTVKAADAIEMIELPCSDTVH